MKSQSVVEQRPITRLICPKFNSLKKKKNPSPVSKHIFKTVWMHNLYIHMHVHLREHRCGFLALLLWGIVQQVRLKGVELSQFVHCKVPLNLLLVHHPEWQRLFGYLSLINLLLHGALKEENKINCKTKLVSSSSMHSQECWDSEPMYGSDCYRLCLSVLMVQSNVGFSLRQLNCF